jgi:ATP-dependent exoDNAse (exonuclease V) alpha subunit
MQTNTPITCGVVPQNEQQRQALIEGEAFLNNPDSTLFGMAGYAGTGKSTIGLGLAKLQLDMNKRVAFCAPTHKALNVLRKIAYNQYLNNIDFFTIHAILGLGMVKTGGEKMLEPMGINYTQQYDAIWLDECSMVGTNLWQFIRQNFAVGDRPGKNPKMILMGDPAQLFPVGEGLSPTFSKDIPGVKLTEVVRQAAGSPLMEFVTSCRKAVTRKAESYRPFVPRFLSSEVSSDGVIGTDRKELLTYACSKVEAFNANPDSLRILAWRNKTVDSYNKHIRRYRYGTGATRFAEGERLIAREPIYAPDKRTVLIQTSTEFVIVEPPREATYGHYQAWQLTVEVEGTGHRKVIYALHEADQARFDAETARLEAAARKNRFLWKHYYAHLETYARVRPCYALTVHNSQGSTFTEVAVDGKDLSGRLYPQDGEYRLKAMQEHNRLWYVGVSRASDRAWVVL